MHKKILSISLLVIYLLVCGSSQAIADTQITVAPKDAAPMKIAATLNNSANQEKSRGQLLYETHCGVCHDTSVHNRNPRKADSIGKIKYFVTRWSTELKLNWSSSEIDEVTQYLNSKYYKHSK